MYVTVFPNADSSINRSHEVELTWEEFVDTIDKFEFAEDRSTVQLLVPARFEDRSPSAQKSKTNVKDVHLASLDIDGVSDEKVAELIEYIDEQGYAGFCYTTWSHAKAVAGVGKKGEDVEPGVRLRVLIPLSRPVRSVEWLFFWKAYNSVFFGLADKSCKDPNRGYYLPAIPLEYQGKEEEKLYKSARFKGTKVIDVDKFLTSYKEDIEKSERGAKDLEGDKESIPREVIQSVAIRLSKSKSTSLKLLGSKMRVALKGEVFEEAGNRNNILYQFAQELAKEFPTGKIRTIAAHFAPAIMAMGELDADSPTVDTFIDMLSRAQQSALAELSEKAKQKELEKLREATKKERTESSDKEMTLADIRKYLEVNGGDPETADDFKPIIVDGNNASDFYVFDGTGFRGPLHRANHYLLLRDTTEPYMKGLGFSVDKIITKDDGSTKIEPKTYEEIVRQHSNVISGSIVINLKGRTFFDSEEGNLHLSEIRPSGLEPRYHQEVEDWIQAVAREETLRFKQWLAKVPDVSHTLAALVFIGPAGIGKSSFMNGIGHLWRERRSNVFCKPCDAADVFSKFNTVLMQTPLILADEQMPKGPNGKVLTTELRSFIASREHYIESKFKNRVRLEGAPRLVLAINNKDKFLFDEVLSGHDIEAVAERFFVIDCSRMTKREADRARRLYNYPLFADENYMAEHVLWLQENMELPDARFGITSNSHAHIMQSSTRTLRWVDWVAEYLLNARPMQEESRSVNPNDPRPVIVFPGSRVFVSPNRIAKHIEQQSMFADNSRKASPRTILKELEPTFASRDSTYLKFVVEEGGFVNHRYYEMDPSILVDAIREQGRSEEYAHTLLSVFYDAKVKQQALRPTQQQREDREVSIKKLRENTADDDEEDDELLVAE
jgi:hypothetical protein